MSMFASLDSKDEGRGGGIEYQHKVLNVLVK